MRRSGRRVSAAASESAAAGHTPYVPRPGAKSVRAASVRPIPIAGDFDYDAGGVGYARQRRTDPRIARLVHAALGDAYTIVNVGAGTGSYEPPGREVTAVEPSATMRAQRPPHLGPAIDATAEELPFGEDAFDAAMAMITIHQWPDPDRGLKEMRRVTHGPVVVLTFDGDALDRLWLADYAPELIAAERSRFPAVDHICEVLGGACTITPVPIPFDCVDGFTEAYYGRPERFLESAVRKAQSAWGFVDAGTEKRAIDRLRADLESGEWDHRYGDLRRQPEFVGALRLITSRPCLGSGHMSTPGR